MDYVPTNARPPAPRGAEELGAFGRASRIAAGAALLVIAVAEDATWLDLAAGLLLLPLIGFVLAELVDSVLSRVSPGALRGSGLAYWARSVAVVALVIAVDIGLTFATPLDGGAAIWIYLGVSMVVAALRGDPACEVIALTNAVLGRRGGVACPLHGPVDAADAAMYRLRRD